MDTTDWTIILGVKLRDGLTDFQRAEVTDALNETLHALVDANLIDDDNDDGWAYEFA